MEHKVIRVYTFSVRAKITCHKTLISLTTFDFLKQYNWILLLEQQIRKKTKILNNARKIKLPPQENTLHSARVELKVFPSIILNIQ